MTNAYSYANLLRGAAALLAAHPDRWARGTFFASEVDAATSIEGPNHMIETSLISVDRARKNMSEDAEWLPACMCGMGAALLAGSFVGPADTTTGNYGEFVDWVDRTLADITDRQYRCFYVFNDYPTRRVEEVIVMLERLAAVAAEQEQC